MCGVVAEGSSRICQQQHPPPQTRNTTNNTTGMVIHGLCSVRSMTNSQEEVHRRWWWRRSPGMDPQSSSGQSAVSQPQHGSHSAVDNIPGPVCSSYRFSLHQEHQKHPGSSRLVSSSPDDAATGAEVLITSRRAGTTCSYLNKTYSRSSRSSSASSRSFTNGDDSSNYELSSREQEFNSVNERLCTDTLEKHLSLCNKYSSLESGCNLGLRYRTSRKSSSDSVEKSSMYSDESRRFSLINNSVMATKDGGPITKSKCSSSIRQNSNMRRFCGLSSQQWIVAVTLLFLASFTGLADACSSRSTPKPRPASPTSRPNVTFLTYACPPAYAAWYCLNGATCFTVKIGDSILYNCECADGYMGQRCEFKDLDGSYLPARDKVLLQTASIAGGATLAVVLVFIVLFSLYVVRQRDKENKFEAEDSDRKPFSGYQNLRSESLCINNPYVQIEDLSDVKVVPTSGKNLLHGEDCSNIKSIICNNMNVGSNMISASAANNNTNSINSLHTPS